MKLGSNQYGTEIIQISVKLDLYKTGVKLIPSQSV